MTEREMEGDTCRACEHNKPTIKVCESCGRSLPNQFPMPFCHKNKIWLVETEMAPCQYFKRGKIWYLGTFEIDFGEMEE